MPEHAYFLLPVLESQQKKKKKITEFGVLEEETLFVNCHSD
jgi:hypothetical protein